MTAAATNTGMAPRAGDEVYLFHPDGTVTPTQDFTLSAIRWKGDFSHPGAYQRQN